MRGFVAVLDASELPSDEPEVLYQNMIIDFYDLALGRTGNAKEPYQTSTTHYKTIHIFYNTLQHFYKTLQNHIKLNLSNSTQHYNTSKIHNFTKL